MLLQIVIACELTKSGFGQGDRACTFALRGKFQYAEETGISDWLAVKAVSKAIRSRSRKVEGWAGLKVGVIHSTAHKDPPATYSTLPRN